MQQLIFFTGIYRSKIYIVRGQQVMLDADLAEIYGYETRYFNRQVQNNKERFRGDDFMFQLVTDFIRKSSKKPLDCVFRLFTLNINFLTISNPDIKRIVKIRPDVVWGNVGEMSGKCSGKVREDALMKIKDCHNDGYLRHILLNDEDKLDNGEHKRYITIESISLK